MEEIVIRYRLTNSQDVKELVVFGHCTIGAIKQIVLISESIDPNLYKIVIRENHSGARYHSHHALETGLHELLITPSLRETP